MIPLLQRSDPFLVMFRLLGSQNFCRGVEVLQLPYEQVGYIVCIGLLNSPGLY